MQMPDAVWDGLSWWWPRMRIPSFPLCSSTPRLTLAGGYLVEAAFLLPVRIHRRRFKGYTLTGRKAGSALRSIPLFAYVQPVSFHSFVACSYFRALESWDGVPPWAWESIGYGVSRWLLVYASSTGRGPIPHFYVYTFALRAFDVSPAVHVVMFNENNERFRLATSFVLCKL